MGELHDLERRTFWEARQRALSERLPLSMVIGAIAALGVVWVLWSRVPHGALLVWCAARLLIAASRIVQATMLARRDIAASRSPFAGYRAMALVDGLAWGAMGWGFTPVDNMEVAVVTISVMLGVATLGVFILQMDFWSATLFITPILAPNAAYALTRPDALGLFCTLAMFGLLLLLLHEASRANRRLLELFRLRFQSEQVARAQAEALRQAQYLSEAKSRFVATMSHEMRTPLHGILGLARWLSEEEQHPDKAHRLALIRKSGEHLISVINDVLDFSRMESSGLPIHKQAFDLHALVNEVAEVLRVGATDKGLSLVVQFDAERHLEVEGDAVRIRQVLNNLIGNAIKFTEQGGIRVHVARLGASSEVAIAVKDSGIGIPPDEVDKVFEAFHQAEGTYQRRFGGTGLGLTISKELCRAMGGDLSCRSEVGQGSEFRFVLPMPVMGQFSGARVSVMPARPLPAPMPHAAPSCSAPHDHDPSQTDDEAAPHVLLVEDNPVNVLVARAQLQQLGVTVSVVNDGLAAVEWLAQEEGPDLVFMDCEMPGLDGFEATRRIRAHERARGLAPVRIVALTANGQETYGDRCFSVGMNGYLAKPFRPEDLARVLAQHLGSAFCRAPCVPSQSG